MSEIANKNTLPEGAGPPGLAVRALTYGDLPRVLAVERRAFATPWSMAMFVLELSKPKGIRFVAEEGEHLRGYMICAHHPDVWHLMNVAVDPGQRRRGIASALIEQLFDSIDEGDRVSLEVRGTNRGAIAMYERFGFSVAGSRRRYYQDNGEDAVVMERRKPAG